MFAHQPRLPLAVPVRVRVRSMRRPFHPSQGQGPYRLPHAVRDRLTASLAPFRNREEAYTLAVFLARFWSAPRRIIEAFHIDRRALADHSELQLTEAKVRGAIRVLEEIGFLDRAIPPSGSKYKATEDGLHRKPIRFVFGSEYAPLFIAANKRTAAARTQGSFQDRCLKPFSHPSGQRGASLRSFSTNSPKNKSVADPQVYLGELRTRKPISIPPKVFEPNPQLEAALERLRRAVGKAGSG